MREQDDSEDPDFEMDEVDELDEMDESYANANDDDDEEEGDLSHKRPPLQESPTAFEPSRESTPEPTSPEPPLSSEIPSPAPESDSPKTLFPSERPIAAQSSECSTQQKDIIRAWLCRNLGICRPSLQQVNPVVQAVGLTAMQVRESIERFHRSHPEPTVERVMAWGKNRFSDSQFAALHTPFEKSVYASTQEKQRLASETGLSVKQVLAWFQNQRAGEEKTVEATFSVDQTAPLYAWVHRNLNDPYPSRDERFELSEETGLTVEQVRGWIKKSRAKITRNKDKKDKKEFEGRCPCCGEVKV